ncbi:SDR family oxidoreductase [Desulfobacterota bacterium AH_259_B03_O07]|nr:SDR family oxidoreductase [Desulfobacterota bacterium AH_259_B03_O07]
MKHKDKVVLITGGSMGLGKASALLLAKEGAKVVITGRTEKTLKEVVDEAKKEGLEIEYIVSDVSNEDDCKAAIDYTINKHGRIDILFNNAGFLHMATTHETPTEIWDKTFDINVKGTYLMSKYTIPHMLEQGKGCIVNNSSVLGLKAVPGVVAYNSSKGAVTQLTRSMALEYADKGIRVNAICPGTIVTPLIEGLFDSMEDRNAAEELFKSFHPIGRLGKPEEIAHAVSFLCDDNVEFMTGNMLSVDGGWIAR